MPQAKKWATVDFNSHSRNEGWVDCSDHPVAGLALLIKGEPEGEQQGGKWCVGPAGTALHALPLHVFSNVVVDKL